MPARRGRRTGVRGLLVSGLIGAVAWQSFAEPVPARSVRYEPMPTYLAVPLDRAGKLAAALPLYQARATQTQTKADRLRYAGALLRAGRVAEAQTVYDALLAEAGSGEHGGVAGRDQPGLCGSNALTKGFPEVALAYLRPAYAAQPGDLRLGLLLVRAYAAVGDPGAARRVLAELDHPPAQLAIGQRLELARGYILTGDVVSGRTLLDMEIEPSVAQMYRESILADMALRDGDWARVDAGLSAAERKAPASLNDTRIDRAWRNVQRELRSVQLRRAIALWKLGQHEAAAAETSRAEASDEEFVRSAALLLHVAVAVSHGRTGEATKLLDRLGGHDVRFTATTTHLRQSLGQRSDDVEAGAELVAILASQDRAASHVTEPLLDILRETLATAAERPLVLHSTAVTAPRGR